MTPKLLNTSGLFKKEGITYYVYYKIFSILSKHNFAHYLKNFGPNGLHLKNQFFRHTIFHPFDIDEETISEILVQMDSKPSNVRFLNAQHLATTPAL